MKKSSIFLLDDHIALRDGLALMLNEIPEFETAGRGTNGSELVAAIEKGIIPDLVLLDLNMPIMDGYQTAAWLKKNQPQIKILVLTMYDTEVPTIRILQEGVRGIAKKEIHTDDLIDAIRRILKGEYYFCSGTTGNMASIFTKDPGEYNPAKKMFTETEMSFLRLCAADKVYKEISTELGLSTIAVDNMRKDLFERLSVKTRTGLALYAIKNGIANF